MYLPDSTLNWAEISNLSINYNDTKTNESVI